jgi:2-furoyl-CoA dehydrogenase FAD binding subunit
MKPAPFKYVRPETLLEALAVLAEHGDDVRVMAGGQSLGAMLNMRIVTPAILLDINRLASLGTIERKADAIATGAMIRQADALADAAIRDNVPLLARALPNVGHYQTRNRGTLGGSVAHADPSAEIPLTLGTLGGEVELRSKRRVRRVMAAEFFWSALVTAREPDELLTALHWPTSTADERCSFIEFSVREGDFAIVAVACVVNARSGRLRLGFGGCGETPQVVELTNIKTLDQATIESIAQEAPVKLDYRSDLLAAAEYRRHLATTLARRAMIAATQEAVHA